MVRLARVIETPIGPLTLVMEGDVLAELRFGDDVPSGVAVDGTCGAEVVRQLEEYFAGQRREFSVPMAAKGTAFQRSVWDELTKIPYGETRAYVDIANALGQPTATRAVGAANGRNPIPIIVPCHRVIGRSGALTGFGGGLPIKRFLLELEGAISPSLIE
jgi:methylated-DNA-[protein]-cysteine S-methyltransferase